MFPVAAVSSVKVEENNQKEENENEGAVITRISMSLCCSLCQVYLTIIFSSGQSFDSHPGLFQFLTFEKALQLDRIIKEVVIMAFRYFYSRWIDEECEETGPWYHLLHGSIAGFALALGCRAVMHRQVDLLPFYFLAAFKIRVLSVYLRHTKISTLDLEVAFPRSNMMGVHDLQRRISQCGEPHRQLVCEVLSGIRAHFSLRESMNTNVSSAVDFDVCFHCR